MCFSVQFKVQLVAKQVELLSDTFIACMTNVCFICMYNLVLNACNIQY